MPIIDDDAVLLLGAGVSAPFHLPLGGDLIDDICDALAAERAKFSEWSHLSHSSMQNRIHHSVSTNLGFKEIPIHAAIASKWRVSGDRSFRGKELWDDFERLEVLEKLLQDQTSETIDDFIVENPEYSEVAKIGISTQLFQQIYRYDNNADLFIAKNFEGRKIWNSNERNWVHLLINLVRQGIRSGQVTEQNRVKIITFNYDMVLERVLDKQFSNTGASYPNWRTYLEISHVHGACGEITDMNSSPADTCRLWANNISVVNEIATQDETAESRRQARSAVANASQLYAVGYAFARPNVELLNMHKLSGLDIKLSYCNWDGNAGLRNTVNRLAREINQNSNFNVTNIGRGVEIESAEGSTESKLSVSDWFKAGYPGDLPG